MGIYSKNTKIARIYRGAAAEISTVRAAVSSNYGHTIHEAEKPFMLHRWLVGDNVANFQIEGIDLTQSNVDIVFSNTILQNTASVFSSTSSDCSINVIRSASGGKNLIGIFRNRDTGGTEHIFNIEYLPATNKVSIQKPGVMVLNEVEYKTATTITDFKLKTSKCFGFVSSFQYGNLNLTPAQLTRDTYEREDINGRRRHAGEWVMVDVNKYAAGLSYILGNVAVSGAFSGNDYLIEGVDFERVAGVITNNGSNLTIQGRISEIEIIFSLVKDNDITPDSSILSLPSYTQLMRSKGYIRWYNSIAEPSHNVYVKKKPWRQFDRVKITKQGTFFDDDSIVTFDSVGLIAPPYFNYARIFDYQEGRNSSNVICTSIKTDVHNLIPVRLKRNIEPSCTYNGKGGTAGEICFWDTISGIAYVDNSPEGAFTEYIP